MVAYVVEQVDAVWLIAGPPLKSMDWMSPYVWEGPDKKLWMMMRGVPNPLNYEDPTGMGGPLTASCQPLNPHVGVMTPLGYVPPAQQAWGGEYA